MAAPNVHASNVFRNYGRSGASGDPEVDWDESSGRRSFFNLIILF